ncbi:IQ motif [Macleaya cordata]|uniref:IQ motif n=1 Tax=Macleaya cordata TaxID=56857 RepID=A0A200PWF4_MACCD|nr:IQ motif [Macleaya cordata]
MFMESSIPGRLAGWEIHGFLTMEDLDIEKLMKFMQYSVTTLTSTSTSTPYTCQKIIYMFMESSIPGRLAGWEIHGFLTMEEANEVHAILCNHTYFNIHINPIHLPKGGTIVLYDRKMLRNFRKDGHNWKKKKDGKSVKEAHEHLKVCNQERIHVYYAHGQDIPNFARRCYWLLDKYREHIVLVHYREILELQGSLVTPVNSNSCASYSDTSVSKILSEETDSGTDNAFYASDGNYVNTIVDNISVRNHEMRLHEINTLDWEDLLVSNDPDESTAPKTGNKGNLCPSYNIPGVMSSFGHSSKSMASSVPIDVKLPISAYPQAMNSTVQRKDFESATMGADELSTLFVKDGLQTQDSFEMWLDNIMVDSPVSLVNLPVESSISTGHESNTSMLVDHQWHCTQEQVFCITDVSPAWAYSTDETKVITIGYFQGAYSHIAESSLFCVFGDVCVPAERVRIGVFRCRALPRIPGFVNFYLSLDGHTPISQVLTFEYRPTPIEWVASLNEKPNLEEFRVQLRLDSLLFSTTNSLNILSSKLTSTSLNLAKEFSLITSSIDKDWENLNNSIEKREISLSQAQRILFELTLKCNLKEWLLERVVEGCTSGIRDHQGQGVIHMCTILGYTWAVQLYSRLGLLLDFRDAFCWTALHWAAFYGRKEMVAVLLLEGADPSLVTDPTSEFPGGCTAADIAAKSGHDGLAAYLAEKGLTAHFRLMSLSGNISGSLQLDTSYLVNSGNLSEEQLCLKDTFAAYNTCANAASRIQAALLGKSLMLQTKAIHHTEPEIEACNRIAAMKIQHAFRRYEIRKRMKSAARIQHRFRTWKIQKDFLNMRWRAIKIQAAFRGHKMRKQYQKIIWSVGVLEKAILRWRQKRKGFRGLQPQITEVIAVDQKEENDIHEDFFRVSHKQAIDRIERSVIRVQALFRSYRAQQEYRKMKLTYDQGKVDYFSRASPKVAI